MDEVTPAVARAVLEPVQPGYPVTEVARRTGGEVSAVYEIRGDETVRPLILKVYAPQWRAKLVKEVYVYRLLARHRIRSIPRVLHASPYGSAALPFAHTVMTRLDGRPLAEVAEPGDGVYRQMGELLAAVHRIGQEQWGYVTTRVVDTRETNTAYMTDQFDRRVNDFRVRGGDAAIADAIRTHVAHHAHLLGACAAPVLCHNDFHQGNVLVSFSRPAGASQRGMGEERTGSNAGSAGTWRVTGCVDVEGAVAADPLFDLARTEYYALADPVARQEFLDGYGSLPPDGAERLALYRLHHAVELWNWAALAGKPADRCRAMRDIEQLLT